MFLNFLQDAFNYESRKVGRLDPEENNGIGVSTAFTSDEGYETALLDANGVHPVERYTDKDKAEKGHLKWIDFAKKSDNQKVTKLGWEGLVDNKEIVLKRLN
jgi:hypothetical protein